MSSFMADATTLLAAFEREFPKRVAWTQRSFEWGFRQAILLQIWRPNDHETRFAASWLTRSDNEQAARKLIAQRVRRKLKRFTRQLRVST
jgi:hypothetical protein